MYTISVYYTVCTQYWATNTECAKYQYRTVCYSYQKGMYKYQQDTLLYVPSISRVHCMYPISEYTVCTQYQSTLYVPNIRVHCMYPISVKETIYVPYISRVHKYQQKTVWLCIPYQYHLKWTRVTDESKEIPFKPLHDKTNAITCVPSEDSDQPGHSPSLIRVFAVRMKKHYVLATLRTYSEDSV